MAWGAIKRDFPAVLRFPPILRPVLAKGAMVCFPRLEVGTCR